jgi:hypothetical protein
VILRPNYLWQNQPNEVRGLTEEMTPREAIRYLLVLGLLGPVALLFVLAIL